MKNSTHFICLLSLLFTYTGLKAQVADVKKVVTKSKEAKVEIKGIAPAYIGLEIEFFQIADYISQKEVLLGRGLVAKDSTFRTSFMIEETQKIFVKVGIEKSFLYVEPNASYTLFLASKTPEVKGLQADLDFRFLGLDETDINYKILDYIKWEDQFLGLNYVPKSGVTDKFMKALDTFKMNVQTYYEKDTSHYFKTYIRFSIAGLDNLEFKGARNKFEKYDFYIHMAPVSYDNDAYMKYIGNYYKKYVSMVSNDINESIYQGVLASSPQKVMKAMGKDYTLVNLRLRELIMLKGLSEIYYAGDFPQTNILQILDSVSKFALFEKNKIVASNLIERLTELSLGSRAPDFAITTVRKDVRMLSSYKGKHLYISFFDPFSVNSASELTLLKALHKRYNGYVEFIMIVKYSDQVMPEEYANLPWDVHQVSDVSDLLKKYKVVTFPSYVFISPQGAILGAPALKPSPNGKGETIDNLFYKLAAAIEYEKKQQNTGLPQR
jgi:hypothetical protein